MAEREFETGRLRSFVKEWESAGKKRFTLRELLRHLDVGPLDSAGSLTGVYPPGHLEELRDEWENRAVVTETAGREGQSEPDFLQEIIDERGPELREEVERADRRRLSQRDFSGVDAALESDAED